MATKRTIELFLLVASMGILLLGGAQLASAKVLQWQLQNVKFSDVILLWALSFSTLTPARTSGSSAGTSQSPHFRFYPRTGSTLKLNQEMHIGFRWMGAFVAGTKPGALSFFQERYLNWTRSAVPRSYYLFCLMRLCPMQEGR